MAWVEIIKRIYIVIIFCLILASIIAFKARIDKEAMSLEDYVSLGNQMGMTGNHIEASKAFKSAVKINPYYIPAYLGLGTAYGNLDRNKEAIEVFKEGIKLNRVHSFVPQMQMGIATIAYDKMRDGKTAVQYVKKALQNYTNQGDYAGVALAGQKLQQIDSDS